MTNCPDQWINCPLSDVSTVTMGQSPESSSYNNKGQGLPFFQGKAEFGKLYPTVRKWCTEPTKIAEAGDILLSVRAPVGPTNLAPDQCCIGRGLAAIRAIKPIEQKYLLHYFRCIEPWLNQQGTGTTFAAISGDFIRALDVPLAPHNEQKRIVVKLDALLERVDACRERLDRVPIILKRFRQAVLAAATAGVLTEDWRGTQVVNQSSLSELQSIQNRKKVWASKNHLHNESQRVSKRAASFTGSTSDQNNLPDGWCWACIEDICNLVVDCHNKTAPYTSQGIPLVRTTNIRNGKLVWDEMRYVSADTYKFWSRRCPPEPGDIVFTREAPMGEATIIPEELQICLGQRTMLFRPFHDLTSASYLLYSIIDRSFLNRAEEDAVGTGVKHLRVGDVSNLLVPLPPQDEQHEIVRRVETLFAFSDRLESRYTAARKQVDYLTPSLLAKAFCGELVPQDPNDEPAEKLLERIIRSKIVTDAKPKVGRKLRMSK